LIERGTPGPWRTFADAEGGVWAREGYGMAATGCGQGNAALIAAAANALGPAMNLVERVLTIHEPWGAADLEECCRGCGSTWPCAEARAALDLLIEATP
jgi:hypothetical protein